MADFTEKSLELAGRHRLIVAAGPEGNEVRIVTPEGATPITIEVSARGVTVRVDSPAIALHASGDLSLSAERLKLEGRRELTLTSGGELAVAADGGSVSVKASDDVKLTGERVMVNCDETIDRYFREPPDRAQPPDAPAAPAPQPAPSSDRGR